MRPLLCAAGLVIWAALAGFGQSGLIEGVVVDPANAVVPQAKVSAFDEAKGIVVRETATGANGAFQLRPLLSGTYTLRVESPGFKTLEKKGLVLDAGQVMNIGSLQLAMGETSASVTIEADVPMVETTTSQKSFVITSEQVSELSLNGRDFGSLILTLPGVTTDAQSDFRLSFSATTGFNVNGGRASMNSVLLDGTHNTDVGDNGAQYSQPSLDAVGEFKVATSAFAAEFGRISGVAITATTKGGGKQYRGGLFYFGRNEALDARPPFDMTGRKTKLRFHQFGGNLGGPVQIPKLLARRDSKLFFFFNHETTRGTRPNGGQYVDVARPELLEGDFTLMLRSGNISTAPQFRNGTVFQPGTVTRNAAGNITGGIPFPNNIVPKSMWSRNAPAFIKIMNRIDRSLWTPTPNAPEQMRIPLRDSYQLRKNQDIARIDYHLNPQTNIFFRWSNDAQHEEQGLGIWSSTPFPVYPMMREKPGSNWSWNIVKLFGRGVINEFIFAYAHQTQVVDVAPGVDKALYDRDLLGFQYGQLFPESNRRNRFPRFNCGVGSCNFTGYASKWYNDGKDYAWYNNTTIMHGSHTFKTGVYFNLDDKQQQPSWNDAGVFEFSSSTTRVFANDSNNGLANLLLGNYQSTSQTNGVFYGSFRFIGIEFYGQDSWRIHPQVTLDIGARYVYLGPTYTRGRWLQNYFDPQRYDPAKAVRIDTSNGITRGAIIPGSGDPYNGMVEENTPGVPSGFGKHRKNQVSPRIGFAYSPFKKNRTSIRGGFGTFFERMRQNVNNFGGLGNPPLTYTPTVFAGNIDQLSPSVLAGGVLFPVSVVGFNKDFFTPTIYSWSFGIQHQLMRTLALDVAYVANCGRHLQYQMDLNQLPLGTTTATSILRDANNVPEAIRPYKGYTNVLYTDYGAKSVYHSLQARLMRRFSKRLTMNANFTWSKVLDDVDTDNTVINYYLDRRMEWGPAGFDRKFVTSIDYVLYLPNMARWKWNNPIGRQALNGWQISGITRIWTGTPLTITANGNSGTLRGTTRADYIWGVNVYPEKQTRDEWFNPLAFGRPLDGAWGGTSKGFLRGPGLTNFNISVFKNFRAGERRNIQFRLETFNTLNSVQFYGVRTSVSAYNPGTAVTQGSRGTSGQISSTRDPRNVQFSLKLYF